MSHSKYTLWKTIDSKYVATKPKEVIYSVRLQKIIPNANLISYDTTPGSNLSREPY